MGKDHFQLFMFMWSPYTCSTCSTDGTFLQVQTKHCNIVANIYKRYHVIHCHAHYETNFSCENKYPISQIVIGGVQPPSGHHPNYCSKEITSGNWNERHNFTVTGKVDYKIDGDHIRKVEIVLRKVLTWEVVVVYWLM